MLGFSIHKRMFVPPLDMFSEADGIYLKRLLVVGTTGIHSSQSCINCKMRVCCCIVVPLKYVNESGCASRFALVFYPSQRHVFGSTRCILSASSHHQNHSFTFFAIHHEPSKTRTCCYIVPFNCVNESCCAYRFTFSSIPPTFRSSLLLEICIRNMFLEALGVYL